MKGLRKIALADLQRGMRLMMRVQSELDPQFRFATPNGDVALSVTFPEWDDLSVLVAKVEAGVIASDDDAKWLHHTFPFTEGSARSPAAATMYPNEIAPASG